MTKRFLAVSGTVMTMSLLAVGGWLLLQPEPAQAANPDWLTDMQKAQEIATKEKKDLLINFTGSDWCSWCVKLKEEVFTKEGFEKAKDKYVLVELDFPNDESLVPPKTREQNEIWMNRFGIQGFPTIVLTDAQGRPYGSLGYTEGGPPAFLAELDKITKVRESRDEEFAKAKEAKGLDKAKLLASAIEKVPAEYRLPSYRAEVQEIISLDDQDQAGLKTQFTKVVQQSDANERMTKLQAELQAAFEKDGPDGVLKLVKDALDAKDTKENPILRGSIAQAQVQLLIRFEKLDEALKALDSLIADAGDDAKTQLGYVMRKGQVLANAERTKEALEVYDSVLKKVEKGGEEWLSLQLQRAELLKKENKPKEAGAIFDEMLTAESLIPVQKAMLLVYAAEAYHEAKATEETAARAQKAQVLVKELSKSEEFPPQFIEQLQTRLKDVSGEKKTEKEEAPPKAKTE